jgi:hypothetical protein
LATAGLHKIPWHIHTGFIVSDAQGPRRPDGGDVTTAIRNLLGLGGVYIIGTSIFHNFESFAEYEQCLKRLIREVPVIGGIAAASQDLYLKFLGRNFCQPTWLW